MKTEERKSEPENAKDTLRKRTLAGTLTLTATLAVLGTSLGVDVKTLFAAEPMTEEGKLPLALQDKAKATPPALQDKAKAIPPALQDKAKAIPPALQDKAKATPPGARQIKIDAQKSGPVEMKIPGTEKPAR